MCVPRSEHRGTAFSYRNHIILSLAPFDPSNVPECAERNFPAECMALGGDSLAGRPEQSIRQPAVWPRFDSHEKIREPPKAFKIDDLLLNREIMGSGAARPRSGLFDSGFTLEEIVCRALAHHARLTRLEQRRFDEPHGTLHGGKLAASPRVK